MSRFICFPLSMAAHQSSVIGTTAGLRQVDSVTPSSTESPSEVLTYGPDHYNSLRSFTHGYTQAIRSALTSNHKESEFFGHQEIARYIPLQTKGRPTSSDYIGRRLHS